MDKQDRIYAMNRMYEDQIICQEHMERAVNKTEQSFAVILKDICWALYQILDSERKREKKDEN